MSKKYILATTIDGQPYVIDQRTLDHYLQTPINHWHQFSRPLNIPIENFQGHSLHSLFEVMRRINYLSYLSALLAKIQSHDIYYVLPKYQEIFLKISQNPVLNIFRKTAEHEDKLLDITMPNDRTPIAIKINANDVNDDNKAHCYYLAKNLNSILHSFKTMGVYLTNCQDQCLISILQMQSIGLINPPVVYEQNSGKLLQASDNNFSNIYLNKAVDFINLIKPFHLNMKQPVNLLFHCLKCLQTNQHSVLAVFNDTELAYNLQDLKFRKKQHYDVIWSAKTIINPCYILSFNNLDDYLEFKLSVEKTQHLDLTDFIGFFK